MPPSLELMDTEATPPSLIFTGSEAIPLSLGMTDAESTPTSPKQKQRGHAVFTRTEA